MQLRELFPDCEAAFALLNVQRLALDSRAECRDALFFAIPGGHFHGAQFAQNAIDLGACAVVSDVERPLSIRSEIAWIKTAQPLSELARCAHEFYKNALDAMRHAAVTGTSGKTTTTYLLESMLRAQGRTVGLLGTVEQRVGDVHWPATHTTLDVLSLCERLQSMYALGARDCVMEVSSHGLAQQRVDALRFDVAGFTNLTPEHLDYHPDMTHYFEAKARLFTALLKPHGSAVIHSQGEYGLRLYERLKKSAVKPFSVGRLANCDAMIAAEKVDDAGVQFELSTPFGLLKIHSQLLGHFNADNIALAAVMALALGVDGRAIERAVHAFENVPGRMQVVRARDGRMGVIDYAHKPDALANALRTARVMTRGKLWCVFGCGGDRDRLKRPQMGHIAATLADRVIVTNDNPRSEEPASIAAQIVDGLMAGGAQQVSDFADKQHAHSFCVELDRARAIEMACLQMADDDWLMVAGKGHERVQIVGESIVPFDDAQVLKTLFDASDHCGSSSLQSLSGHKNG